MPPLGKYAPPPVTEGEEQLPPTNYIPGSTYVPPSAAPIYAPGPEEGHMPGPPTEAVPGSTYVPPVITKSGPAQPNISSYPTPGTYPPPERPLPGVNPTLVPGTERYHPEFRPMWGYIPAGLGAGTPPRITESPAPPPMYAGLGQGGVPDRERAPRLLGNYAPVNPSEPQMPIPGSAYAPDIFGAPPIGSGKRVWHDPTPGQVMGGPTMERTRKNSDVIFTTHPASGGRETMRWLPGDGELLMEPEERPYGGTQYPPPQPNLEGQMRAIEEARRKRYLQWLRGIWGGGE